MNYKLPLYLIAFLFLSCSLEEQENTIQNEKVISVNFDLGGELSLAKLPLKNSDTLNPDLLAIQFYDQAGSPYAFVVGDNVTEISVDLYENQSYKIKATYVKKGKNKLYYWEQFNEWGGPFATRSSSGTILNKTYYSSTNEIFPARAQVETKEDYHWGKYSEVERFYGVAHFSPSSEDSIVNINLSRMAFGLKAQLSLEDENLDVANILFSISNGQFPREYVIPVSEGVAHLEIPFLTLAIPQCQGCAIALDFALEENYAENISISIGTSENPIRFFEGEMVIKRNKMMVLNHTLVEQEKNTGGFGN